MLPLLKSAVLSLAILIALTPLAASAQDKGSLPPELAVVPRDATAFIYLRPAELWHREPVAGLRKLFPDETAGFLKELGDDPTETESFIILYPTPNSLSDLVEELRDGSGQPGNQLVFIETTVKPMDRGKVLERVIGKEPVEKKHAGKTYFESQGKTSAISRGAVYFVNERTYVFSVSPEMVKKMLEGLDRPRTEDPLGAALKLAAQKRQVVAGFNASHPAIARASKKFTEQLQLLENTHGRVRDPFMAPLAAMAPLLEIRSAALALSLGKDMRLEGEAVYPSERHAENVAGHFEDALVLFRLFFLSHLRAEVRSLLQMTIHEDEDTVGPLVYAGEVLLSSKRTILKQQRDIRPFVLVDLLLKQVESGLRRASVEQRQATLHVKAQFPSDLDSLDNRGREEARSMVSAQAPARQLRKSSGNLSRLISAILTYHDIHGTLPASAISDKAGKPLLSWRVAILPYLDEQALYQQFKLDQPWDSPHNIKLLPRMPDFYAAPGVSTKVPFTTFYQVFTGPTAMFDLQSKLTLAKITDGPQATIGIVEAQDPVPWTKPADLAYDAKKPLPKLGGVFPEGFHAAFMDGSVRFLSPHPAAATIRAMITFAGGEPVLLLNDKRRL
jgi:hypothetical protein